jgi:hypothetical protein
MRERARGFRFTAVPASMACLAFLVAACPAQAQQKPAGSPSTAQDSLKTFLRGYLRTFPGGDDPTTRYSAAFVDLNGDGKPEVIVHVSGRDWCGTGGCTTFILARKDASYRVIGWIPATRTPIRVLASTSHGWRNISAWVRGDAVVQDDTVIPHRVYEAELRFDGTRYHWRPDDPFNPPLVGKVAGEVVISGSDAGTLLYP